jgi:hypothetical protein
MTIEPAAGGWGVAMSLAPALEIRPNDSIKISARRLARAR